MKTTLSFTLPDEKEELDMAMKGPDAFVVLATFARHLRTMTKFPPEGQSEETTTVVSKIREQLHELIEEYGLNI